MAVSEAAIETFYARSPLANFAWHFFPLVFSFPSIPRSLIVSPTKPEAPVTLAATEFRDKSCRCTSLSLLTHANFHATLFFPGCTFHKILQSLCRVLHNKTRATSPHQPLDTGAGKPATEVIYISRHVLSCMVAPCLPHLCKHPASCSVQPARARSHQSPAARVTAAKRQCQHVFSLLHRYLQDTRGSLLCPRPAPFSTAPKYPAPSILSPPLVPSPSQQRIHSTDSTNDTF